MTLRHRYVFLLSLLDSGMRMKKERKKLEAKRALVRRKDRDVVTVRDMYGQL